MIINNLFNSLFFTVVMSFAQLLNEFSYIWFSYRSLKTANNTGITKLWKQKHSGSDNGEIVAVEEKKIINNSKQQHHHASSLYNASPPLTEIGHQGTVNSSSAANADIHTKH